MIDYPIIIYLFFMKFNRDYMSKISVITVNKYFIILSWAQAIVKKQSNRNSKS